MTGVQCEPVPWPLSSRSPAGRCACQAGGGTLSSGQGARVADSSQAQPSLPAHWTLNLRGPSLQVGGRSWESGAGPLAGSSLNGLDSHCPSARASQVQTSWSLPQGADPPHPTSPSGPSPPGCCAPLHMPQRSHLQTCAHRGPQNETLPDKERACRALSTHCGHSLHIFYLLCILGKSLVAACSCELNTAKLRGGLPRSPWGPAACLHRAPPAAFSALCFGFPAHHQWLRIQ